MTRSSESPTFVDKLTTPLVAAHQHVNNTLLLGVGIELDPHPTTL